MEKKSTLNKVTSVLLLLGAGLALFLAESSYWINHTIFNQQTFTTIATTELQKESSLNAISNAVVDEALANRPVAKRIAGDRAVSLVSGLLGSDASSQALNVIANKSYAYMTKSNRQDIKIDLTSLKTLLGTLITLAQSQGAGDRLVAAQAQIPDEIVLVQSDALPNLSGVVQTMLWVGPLLWLLTIIFLTLYIYIGRREYARRVYLAGLTVSIVAVFGLLAIPFIPPPIAAAIPNIQLRAVAENLTTGFLAPFKTQMVYLLGFALVTLLVFNQRFNIVKAVTSLGTKLAGVTSAAANKSKTAEKKPARKPKK